MAKHIKDILTEWFYRLPKGYAIKPYNQKELQVLEEILTEKGIHTDPIIKSLKEDDFQLDQAFNDAEPVEEQLISEAQEYPDAVLTALQQDPAMEKFYPEGLSEIPPAQNNYVLPAGGGAMKVQGDHDKTIFNILYFVNAQDQTVGNGEVALWWLFNYSGGSSAEDTRLEGSGAPDLRIDGNAVEVKSFKSHNQKTQIGRWSEFKDLRRVVSNLFGIHALTKAFQQETVRPVTEITFIYKDLQEASKSLLAFLNLPGLADLVKQFGETSVFGTMVDQCTFVMTKLNEIVGEKYNFKLSNSSSEDDIAKAVALALADTKFGIKPADKGYIASVKKGDPTDIHFHYIDMELLKTSKDAASHISVSGGSISVNISKVFGKN